MLRRSCCDSVPLELLLLVTHMPAPPEASEGNGASPLRPCTPRTRSTSGMSLPLPLHPGGPQRPEIYRSRLRVSD